MAGTEPLPALSDSPIGPAFRRRNRGVAAGCGFAAVAIGVDLYSAMNHSDELRAVIAIVAVAVCLVIAGGDRASLGLTLRSQQPWRFWCKVTLIIAVVMVVLIGIFSMLALLLDWQIALPRTPPERLLPEFYRMCIIAPVSEEAVYRIVLCAPLMAAVGARWTIALGGIVFGLLHVIYGNPAPDNLLAGYFLVWAYLKSGTIVVPLAWHSLGNAAALCAHIVNWYAS